MDEIKSALDRAMERAEQMGRLSPEELRLQNEAKYKPIGQAIAQRFLEHGQTRILAEQLDKFGTEGKVIATHSAISTLIGEIHLENIDLTQRSLDGITFIKKSNEIKQTADEIMALFGKYAWQKKLLYEENSEDLGKEANARITTAGITGNAIAGINIETNEEWKNKSEKWQLATGDMPTCIRLSSLHSNAPPFSFLVERKDLLICWR